VECLKDELEQITRLGPHLSDVTAGIFGLQLRQDKRADKLIAAMSKFCVPMHLASWEIIYTFEFAANFYLHTREERRGFCYNPGPITPARVAKLLEPDWQAKALLRARRAASQAAKAAKAVREHALPLLPQLEQELDDYVANYVARATSIEERKKSWIPSVLQNALWGAIKPPHWTEKHVQTYPSHLSTVTHMLHKLPTFLDNMELHFRRLSEVDSQQLLEYGYTTPNDLTRLFKDRLICQDAACSFFLYWDPLCSAISIGFPSDRKKVQ
jgi:hypothetical protein